MKFEISKELEEAINDILNIKYSEYEIARLLMDNASSSIVICAQGNNAVLFKLNCEKQIISFEKLIKVQKMVDGKLINIYEDEQINYVCDFEHRKILEFNIKKYSNKEYKIKLGENVFKNLNYDFLYVINKMDNAEGGVTDFET